MEARGFENKVEATDPEVGAGISPGVGALRPVQVPLLADPRDALYGSPELLMASKEVLTIAEVSYVVRLGDTKLREMRESGELVARKDGRLVHYPTSVIRAYLQATR